LTVFGAGTVVVEVADQLTQARDETLYAGLQEIASGAFPKSCACCGRQFATVENYVHQTGRVFGRSGLKQTLDDDGHVVVELFRNCVCGSTLMDCFSNRRETSSEGARRRQRFSELIDLLIGEGLARDFAQVELIKVLRGEHSDILRMLPGL